MVNKLGFDSHSRTEQIGGLARATEAPGSSRRSFLASFRVGTPLGLAPPLVVIPFISPILQRLLKTVIFARTAVFLLIPFHNDGWLVLLPWLFLPS
jgi:hypothetical protein